MLDALKWFYESGLTLDIHSDDDGYTWHIGLGEKLKNKNEVDPTIGG